VRKYIICVIMAVLAALTVTAVPASAGTHHIRPALVGVGRSDANCNLVQGLNTNTDGSAFYSVNIHYSKNPDGTLCYLQFRSVAKCYSPPRNQTLRVNGPWQTVSPNASWSRSNCPTGYYLTHGGWDGIRDDALGSTLGPLNWIWPSTSSAISLTSASRVDCSITTTDKYNSSQEPVWGESEMTQNNCGSNVRIRGAIQVCVRTICNSSGLFFGGWVAPLNKFSRATSGITNARLDKAWGEFRNQDGTYTCYRYVPTFISDFSCDPNNP
jgi:hypothetical protein